MAYWLYILRNNVTGSMYVGVTKTTPQRRLNAHRCAARRGVGGSALYDAMRKYGVAAFSIWLSVECDDEDQMYAREREMIAQLRERGQKLYNIKPGGRGEGRGSAPVRDREALREKLRAARQGKTPALGMRHTDANKKVFSAAARRRWEGKVYPVEVLTVGHREAKERWGISTTHYYRLQRVARGVMTPEEANITQEYAERLREFYRGGSCAPVRTQKKTKRKLVAASQR